MRKVAQEVRSKPKPRAISKSRKSIAKRGLADEAKPDFIGRLKGVFRIVGDIESPVVPPEAWEYD
jgi:hypothetical protein